MRLQQKSRDRALSTLQKVTADYDGIWLFVKAGAVSNAFEPAMRDLSPELTAMVRMLPLESD